VQVLHKLRQSGQLIPCFASNHLSLKQNEKNVKIARPTS
jgi:hypothetical protein